MFSGYLVLLKEKGMDRACGNAKVAMSACWFIDNHQEI